MLSLVFKIRSNASRCYVTRWNVLKRQCERDPTRDLVAEWLQNCQLEKNRRLLFTPCNGGVLGHSKKHIRFRHTLAEWWNNDVFIVFDHISTKWDLEELDDLKLAFQKLCNTRIKADLVRGYLKIETEVISS